MLQESKYFSPYNNDNAFADEGRSFTRTILVVPMIYMPAHANVLSSHTMYKFNIEENHSLSLKGHI